MASDTSTRVSQLLETTKQAMKRFVKFMNKVVKPGGWRYLRPVEPEGQADETTKQLLQATDQLAGAEGHEAGEKPRSKRRAA